MAAKELSDFIRFGNIKNSVNYPDCQMAMESKFRVTVAHKNIPNMISKFSALFSDANINIINMMNKSKKDNAYTIVDVDSVPDGLESELGKMDGVHRVRIIRG